MVVDPAVEADLEAILAIERASFAHPWPREAFTRDLVESFARLEVLRRLSDGAILGFTSYWLAADEIHLLNLATAPGSRRRGLASQILRHLLDFGQAEGYRVIWLEVRRGNNAAQQLYLKFAFQPAGVRRRYYEDREDALLMARIL